MGELAFGVDMSMNLTATELLKRIKSCIGVNLPDVHLSCWHLINGWYSFETYTGPEDHPFLCMHESTVGRNLMNKKISKLAKEFAKELFTNQGFIVTVDAFNSENQTTRWTLKVENKI